MQVEFNKDTLDFQSVYASFPAFEIDLDTAEDLKTHLMSDMPYTFQFVDDIYKFEVYNQTFTKIRFNYNTTFIVTIDSFFKALDDIVEYYNDYDNNDEDYEYEDNDEYLDDQFLEDQEDEECEDEE
jgi:hypothetical protein